MQTGYSALLPAQIGPFVAQRAHAHLLRWKYGNVLVNRQPHRLFTQVEDLVGYFRITLHQSGSSADRSRTTRRVRRIPPVIEQAFFGGQ